MRSIEHERAEYVAAILCEACDRQVMVIRDEPGEAVDAAIALFMNGCGTDG